MNEELKEIKEKIKRSSKYILYVEFSDIEKLLKYIEKQQKEIERMQTKINKIVLMIRENYDSDWYDDYETIAGLRDDIYNLLTKNRGE